MNKNIHSNFFDCDPITGNSPDPKMREWKNTLEYLYNGILLLGNKEQTINIDDKTEEPLNIMLSERDLTQREHNL